MDMVVKFAELWRVHQQNLDAFIKSVNRCLRSEASDLELQEIKRLVYENEIGRVARLASSIATRSKKQKSINKRIDLILFFQQQQVKNNVFATKIDEHEVPLSQEDLAHIDRESQQFLPMDEAVNSFEKFGSTSFVSSNFEIISQPQESVALLQKRNLGHLFFNAEVASDDEIEEEGSEEGSIEFIEIDGVLEFLGDEYIVDSELDETEEKDEISTEAFLNFDPDELLPTEDVEDESIYLTDREKVTRAERALQFASEFLEQVRWSKDHLSIIKEIFYNSGRGVGQTRQALLREINKGLTPIELRIAYDLRYVWSVNDRFWLCFYTSGSFGHTYSMLTWPIAALIARTFNSIPEQEELEYLLDSIFECWLENSHIHHRYKAFSLYLAVHFAELGDAWHIRFNGIGSWPYPLDRGEYSDLGLNDPYNNKKQLDLNNYGFNLFL